jgi:serine/threonine-protein kinase
VIDIGSVVNGKYRLVRILGDGGMGSVYEATHAVLGTRVAIKVLHPELVRRTGLVERFLQEARVVAQIRSPHVVQVIDVDRTPDGHAYIVMELLEGEPLSSVVDRQRKLPVATACEYTVQILEALEAAHALGVVHRDLKPENVFVTFTGGRPILKLIDFGIAKAQRLDPRQKNLTVAGVVMGTAEYMAPEQARSADRVDPRADLYAVGVMLYEMIAGARPVRGDTGEDARVIALKVERGEVIPLVQVAPSVPRDLAGLVHHAMAARPEMRFATATEMRLALIGAMAGKRPPTKPLSQQPPGATVSMGPAGPVRTAASPVITGANVEEPHVDTVRAAPVATAMAAPVYLGTGMQPMEPVGDPARQHRRRVPIAAILGLTLLLGVSVLGILVGTGTIALSSGPPEPPPAVTPAAVPTPVATSAATPTGTPAVTAPPALPTLVPTRPAPTTPRPVPSNRPAPESDAGVLPPFVLPTALPTTLPPFPSVFPLPPGFPSTLPSGFPAIPGWPPIPLPQPPPKQAPSGSAG